MTPKQALVMIENIKREAPDKLVAASNTVALESAQWAQAAINRDKRIYAELQEIKKLLLGEVPAVAEATAEVTASTNGTHTNGKHAPAVDLDNLKDEALEAFMDSATSGMPANPNAPIPEGFAPPVTEEEAEVVVAPPAPRPPGVVVVPAAAAKAKAKTNDASPKA